MLDQNTDRMWYVIGAVIVGAALILLMNGAFPNLFASVGETFKGKTEQVTEMTDGIMPMVPQPNLIGPNDLGVTKNATDVSYDAQKNEWSFTIKPNGATDAWDNGLYIKDNVLEIPYGKAFSLSYEIFIPEGYDPVVSLPDINNIGVNGWKNVGPGSGSGNDNDEVGQRLHNGVLWNGEARDTATITLKPGEWTKVWYGYTNTHPNNTDKVALKDSTRFGFINSTTESIPVKIRNVKGEHSRYPTTFSEKEEVK